MRESSAIRVCVFLLAATAVAVTVNPGLRIAITDKGLEYLRRIAVPLIECELATMKLPDIAGEADVEHLFRVDYNLSNITLSDLTIPKSLLTAGPDGIMLLGSDIAMKMKSNVYVREHAWPHAHYTATADIDINTTSLLIAFKVGMVPNGSATLDDVNCKLSVGDFSIKFHGGASWFINLFDGVINPIIKSQLNKQLCEQAIPELNYTLLSLPLKINLGDVLIDLSLVKPMDCGSGYAAISNKGEFYSTKHPVEAPYTPPVLPPVSDTSNYMLSLWFTDYVLNTGAYVYQSLGVFKYNVTQKQIPPDVPFQLNTNFFEQIIPEFYKKYPNMAIVLGVEALKPPVVNFYEKSINATIPGGAIFYVVNSTTSRTEWVFTLSAAVDLGAIAWLQPNKTDELVCANITSLSIKLDVLNSSIDHLNISGLQSLVDFATQFAIIPVVNPFCKAIPSIANVSVTHPSLTFGKGYIRIDTDISYDSGCVRAATNTKHTAWKMEAKDPHTHKL